MSEGLSSVQPVDERARLVDAATALFYAKGYHVTGIDDILAETGIGSTTLQKYFKSKEDLIVAVMERRDEQFSEWFRNEVNSRASEPRERVLAAFDILQEWYEGPGFHGCMFLNASVEFRDPEDPVHRAAAYHKQRLYDYFRELTATTGAEEPAQISEQLVLLMEGAVATTQVTGNPPPPARPGSPPRSCSRMPWRTRQEVAVEPRES